MRLVFALIPIACWLAAVVGYIMNIVKVVGLSAGPFSTELAVRLVGIVAVPLGCIAGWF